jgi:hypothetical protein
MLRDEISKLQNQCMEMSELLAVMQARLGQGKNEWPDFQVRVGAKWYDRSKIPPKGFIWASDGVSVWRIQGRGTPIPESATRVKFWTDCYIPAPPGEVTSS